MAIEAAPTRSSIRKDLAYTLLKIGETEALEQIRTLELLGEATAALEEVTGYGIDEQRAADTAPDKARAATS